MSNSTQPSPVPDAQPASHASAALRVLIPFATVALYGMERGVFEIFDALRPRVEPHFVLTNTARDLDYPVYHAILRHGFSHSFFRDRGESWPKIGLPRSPSEAAVMLRALWITNTDTLRASREQDALYVASIHHQMFAVLAARAIRKRGGRVIYHFHDLGLNGFSAKLFNALLPLVSDVVHNTEFSMQQAQARFPRLKRMKNTVIPFASKISTGPADPALEARLRETTNLVFVGQVARHKGVDLLLEALDRILPEYPHVRLQIVGQAADPVFQARIDELLARPNLREQCIHWGFRDDVHSFLSHAYAFVQPSRPSLFHESFGRGAVEAMSLGVPTVCLESGALQAIVKDGETGLICREESPEALAAVLRRLLDAPGVRQRMSDGCRAEYAATYTPEQVRRQWLSFLDLPTEPARESSAA